MAAHCIRVCTPGISFFIFNSKHFRVLGYNGYYFYSPNRLKKLKLFTIKTNHHFKIQTQKKEKNKIRSMFFETFGVPGQLRTFGVPGQPRTFDVPGQVRTFGVPGQLRKFGVPGQLRTFGVPGQLRTFGVPGQLRTFGVPGQPRTFCTHAYVHNRGQAGIN